MESSMSACSGAMAMACSLGNGSRGTNTNNATIALDRFSNRCFVYSEQSRVQYYGGMVKPYCGKNNKLEKGKSKDLCALSEGCLSEKKRMKLLQLLSKDLSVLSTFPEDATVSLKEQIRAQILSDAVNVVMRQLEQAKAESKERKQQLKAQKKALKFGEKQRKNEGGREDSSPPSSCIGKYLHIKI